MHARSRDACSGNRGACSEYQCVCIPTAGMPTQATAAHTQHQQRTRSSSNFGNMLQPNSNLACMFVRCRGTRASGVCGVSCRSARLALLRAWFLGAGFYRLFGHPTPGCGVVSYPNTCSFFPRIAFKCIHIDAFRAKFTFKYIQVHTVML